MSKEQWIADRNRLWEEIDEDGVHCKSCEYCERTKDAYGTGDSPTLRECTGSPDVCPGVAEDWTDGMYAGDYEEPDPFEGEI